MAKVKDWAIENEDEREWYHHQATQFLAWTEFANPELYERIVSGEISYQFVKSRWLKPFPGRKKLRI